MHANVVLFASTFPIPGISVLTRTRTIDELLTDLHPFEPGITGPGELLFNTHLLIRFARDLGASRRELSYMRDRRTLIFADWINEAVFRRASLTLSSGKAYTEVAIRAVTLCEIYDSPLAERLHLAIMAG